MTEATQMIVDTLSVGTDSLMLMIDSVQVTLKSQPSESEMAWMPFITAMIVVILGFIGQYFITKRQIKTQHTINEEQIKTQRSIMLSGNRQEWINTLRDQVSEYLAKVSFLLGKIKIEGIEYIDIGDIEKTYLIMIKIHLLINPKEKDHEDFVNLISDLYKEIDNIKSLSKEEIPKYFEDINKLQNSIISQSQSILKREWERIKLGD